MKHSSISWTDHTFNGWIGCTKISPGCAHCYAAATMDNRLHRVQWGAQGTRIRTSADNWKQPLKWNREASAARTRTKVFTASLADVFEDRSELTTWRDDLHRLIADTPHLDWLVLTKRPEIAARYYQEKTMPKNIWLGTSVENSATASKRISILQSIEAPIRFLSCEPLLEDLGKLNLTGIHWVIVGGESGRNHRPIDADWVRSIREQCRDSKTTFFFKQWGGTTPKKNGNILDGETHEHFPTATITPNFTSLLK
jgi:protein gp37